MKKHWLGIGTLGVIITSSMWASAQQPDKPTNQKPTEDKAAEKSFGQLIHALKASPGCLGVETARTGSGKEVIFAWFENKKAVSQWYYSDTHNMLMKTFFPSDKYDKPMQDVPDDGKPILAIASVTFSDKPKFKETKLPISQISIELYQPVSGGIFLGGRFAPEALKTPKMKDYTPKEK
jgi:hypothetical protein